MIFNELKVGEYLDNDSNDGFGVGKEIWYCKDCECALEVPRSLKLGLKRRLLPSGKS